MDFQYEEDYLLHQFSSNYSTKEHKNEIRNSFISCDQVSSSLIQFCSEARPLSNIKQNTVVYNDVNMYQQRFRNYSGAQQQTNKTHPNTHPLNPLNQNNNKQSHTYGKTYNEGPDQFNETPLFFEQNNFSCFGNQQCFISNQNLNFNPQQNSQAALATKQSLEKSCHSVLYKHSKSNNQFHLRQQASQAVSGATDSQQLLSSQKNDVDENLQNRLQQIRMATSKMDDFRKPSSEIRLSNLKDFQEKYSIETPLYDDKVVQYYTGYSIFQFKYTLKKKLTFFESFIQFNKL